MRKLKIYLDTSVISYLDQTDAPERMAETKALWKLLLEDRYEVYISETVLREIGQCPEEKREILTEYLSHINYHIVSPSYETIHLAEKFIDRGVLTKKSFDDCQHIAAALYAGCDIIASWNFKHIVNIKTIRGARGIAAEEGYKELLIYSPSSLIEIEEDEDENN